MLVTQSQPYLMLLQALPVPPRVSWPLLSFHLQGHSELPCHRSLCFPGFHPEAEPFPLASLVSGKTNPFPRFLISFPEQYEGAVHSTEFVSSPLGT